MFAKAVAYILPPSAYASQIIADNYVKDIMKIGEGFSAVNGRAAPFVCRLKTDPSYGSPVYLFFICCLRKQVTVHGFRVHRNAKVDNNLQTYKQATYNAELFSTVECGGATL